ncbi:hypothetical protein DIPPA_28146 [Diplonema papillatum]|nr:hypothetical protein DIPPA_28146 [Diplonema papillatum]
MYTSVLLVAFAVVAMAVTPCQLSLVKETSELAAASASLAQALASCSADSKECVPDAESLKTHLATANMTAGAVGSACHNVSSGCTEDVTKMQGALAKGYLASISAPPVCRLNKKTCLGALGSVAVEMSEASVALAAGRHDCEDERLETPLYNLNARAYVGVMGGLSHRQIAHQLWGEQLQGTAVTKRHGLRRDIRELIGVWAKLLLFRLRQDLLSRGPKCVPPLFVVVDGSSLPHCGDEVLAVRLRWVDLSSPLLVKEVFVGLVPAVASRTKTEA